MPRGFRFRSRSAWCTRLRSSRRRRHKKLATLAAGCSRGAAAGVVRALGLAHRQPGKLAWKTLFQPAIALAEQGFALSPRLHAVLMDDAAKTLRNDPAAAAYFLEPDGTPKRVGTLLRNPQYAAV